MKRFVTLLLTILLVLAMMPTGVFAAASGGTSDSLLTVQNTAEDNDAANGEKVAETGSESPEGASDASASQNPADENAPEGENAATDGEQGEGTGTGAGEGTDAAADTAAGDIPAPVEEPHPGFCEIGGETYYFSDDLEKQKGFKTIDGGTYYFGRTSGKMYTGVVKIKGDVYTFDETGLLVRTVYKDKKAVALTYDDGPSANTKTILNLLEKYDARATFFVIGKQVKGYAKTVKRAADMGCQIGNHSWSHAWFTKLTVKEIQNEIAKCDSKLETVIGKKPDLIRTPGGFIGSRIQGALDRPVILWSIDTRDWEHKNPDKTYSIVMKYVKDGDIILMHDLYKQTADASKKIIPELVKQGYQLVTVEELSLLKGKKLKKQKAYYSMR